jgi:hypothetical protein
MSVKKGIAGSESCHHQGQWNLLPSSFQEGFLSFHSVGSGRGEWEGMQSHFHELGMYTRDYVSHWFTTSDLIFSKGHSMFWEPTQHTLYLPDKHGTKADLQSPKVVTRDTVQIIPGTVFLVGFYKSHMKNTCCCWVSPHMDLTRSLQGHAGHRTARSGCFLSRTGGET